MHAFPSQDIDGSGDRAMKHVREFIVTSLAGGLLIVVPILP